MPREQKVNEKNSWSLDLIDHMGRDINEASGDGGQGITNFQRAAGTLEAGIKIYSYRVDSVYTETFKLMGGLNRTSGCYSECYSHNTEDCYVYSAPGLETTSANHQSDSNNTEDCFSAPGLETKEEKPRRCTKEEKPRRRNKNANYQKAKNEVGHQIFLYLGRASCQLDFFSSF